MNWANAYRKVSFRLFHWRGVDVYIDLTTLFIVLGYFLGERNSWWGQDRLLISVLLGGLVVFSILVHELAHAWVGLMCGAKVEKIYLNVLGGVCIFRAMPESPWRNFLISVAGSLSNFVLWGMFTILYQQQLSRPQELVWLLVFQKIAEINLILTIFNAFPAYPLDGGRAIHSLLTFITGEEIIGAWLLAFTGVGLAGWLGWLALKPLGYSRPDIFGSILLLLFALLILVASLAQLQRVRKPPQTDPASPTPEADTPSNPYHLTEASESIPLPDPAAVYKEPEGYQKMLGWYDSMLKKLPIPYESLYINTRYGLTHVLALGPQDAPPLIMLATPGDGVFYWRDIFAALSQNYRIYAPDIIGGMGRSTPVRLSPVNAAYGNWLLEVLQGLHIKRADFIGDVVGCRYIFKLAMLEPECISRAVLLTPDGLAPRPESPSINAAIVVTGLLTHFSHLPLFARWFIKACSPSGSKMNPQHRADVAEFLCLYLKYYREDDNGQLLSEAEQRSLIAPTLVLVGVEGRVYDCQAILDQSIKILPNLVAAEVVPGAISNIVGDQTEWLKARLLKFLKESC